MPARTERNPYEKGEAIKLARMYAKASTVRGTTPDGDPARIAGDTVAKIIADRRDSIDPPYTYYELATPLIVNGRTLDQRALRFFLARRGYEQLPPSQKPYKGVSTNVRHRTATAYACGHPRTPDNTWHSSRGLDICKTCQENMNRDYQARQRTATARVVKGERPSKAVRTKAPAAAPSKAPAEALGQRKRAASKTTTTKKGAKA